MAKCFSFKVIFSLLTVFKAYYPIGSFDRWSRGTKTLGTIALVYYFPEKCQMQLNITKVRIFLISLSITFSNPKILGFLFFVRKIA